MTLLQKLTPVILGAFLVVSLGFFITADASALNIFEGINAARGEGQPDDLFGNGGVITTITNVLLFIIGALSVIMLIIGGLRYVVSGGNATAVTAAKNTILYAIVGLIIAFLAYAAINFVISSITPGGGGGTNV